MGVKRPIPRTPFHLPDPSPWPFWAALSLESVLLGMAKYFHGMPCGVFFLGVGFMSYVMYMWFSDIIFESLFQGMHTWAVQRGLRHAFILFLVSEAFFFFSFFWGFFHGALVPSESGGKRWPPIGIHTMNWVGIPLLNTAILVSSAFSVTWSHKALRKGKLLESCLALLITLIHGLVFLYFQYVEFKSSGFTIADGVYGSGFFMLVGLHGMHVMVGVVALFVSLVRMVGMHFSTERHLGYRFAIWYWHFVDVIWVILFGLVYVWKS
uniref:Cytochrome c oxidase subunit 3 n=1 Tax=Pinctada albina TaxID=315487 RepID=A0A1S5UZM2_9BIVA|nr:cytochrome c oxidase subunit 3 [Pinctada albina]